MSNLSIRSRHKSIESLRKTIPIPVRKAVYRHGSTTVGEYSYEINSVESIKNSSSKLKMKTCFTKSGVITPEWWIPVGFGEVANLEGIKTSINDLKYPVVLKHVMGSRNSGNHFIKSSETLVSYLRNVGLSRLHEYIVEKYYTYCREYRLHVTSERCFYACRKMIKSITPSSQRWFRNDSNSVWMTEENPKFERPSNWEAIVSECIKALKCVELDVGGFDVRVQAEKEGREPKFIIIESNSACSLRKVGLEKYSEELPRILATKYKLNPCVV